jgi:hypothetical protein
MLITILAKKLYDAVSEADARMLVGDKCHKFLEFLSVFFIQYLV